VTYLPQLYLQLHFDLARIEQVETEIETLDQYSNGFVVAAAAVGVNGVVEAVDIAALDLGCWQQIVDEENGPSSSMILTMGVEAMVLVAPVASEIVA
jgi:hypothetical protein